MNVMGHRRLSRGHASPSRIPNYHWGKIGAAATPALVL
jgi:hypothetical protein